MTAPIRLIAITIGLLLLAAPAAHAATSAAWDNASKVVTLTNDEDGETFTIALTESPVGYKVTAANAAIALPAPAGSNCLASDAGKTLTCDGTVNCIILQGGAGGDAFTISGSTNYYYSAPGLSIDGGAGDDTLTAGTGAYLASSITGGADNDTFFGSNAYGEDFYAEPGNDTYHGGTATVPAGFDADYFQQRTSDEFYPATALTVRSKRAADLPITASLDGVANDTDGEGGTDNLLDMEVLHGSGANDTLTAGSTAVRITGQGGDDTLSGSPLADSIYGGGGNDSLRGGGGDDLLYDGDYDPTYRLASETPTPAGNDTIDGGDGDDILAYGAGKDDVHGGGGLDTATYSRVQTQVFDTAPTTEVPTQWLPLTLSLNDQADDGATGANEGDNLHSDVENIDTTATGYRSDRRAHLRGSMVIASFESTGADTITGSDAANFIRTGGGNDSVTPGGGADSVDAGRGDDQINAVDKITDVITCGPGTDNVGADLAGTNAGRADVLNGCENVTGTPLGLEGGVLPTLPVVPKLTLGGKATVKAKTFLKKLTVGVDVTTDQPATVTGELATKQATISTVGALTVGSGKLGSGTGKRTLKLRVAKKFQKTLKRKLKTKKQRRKGIKLSAVITVKNAAGQTAVSRRTIKIKG